MISVHIMSEDAIRGQNLMDVFVISITSPGQEHPKIEGSNVHQFHFHDVRESYECSDGRTIMPMNESIADQIAELALKNRDCDRWIIHCEMGISRSPGVAIGLARHIELRPGIKRLKSMYQAYNKHVALLVERAVAKKIDEIDKELRGV